MFGCAYIHAHFFEQPESIEPEATMTLLLKILTSLLLIVNLTQCSKHTNNFSNENSTFPLINGKHEIVIELTIVCDLDCSQLFQKNKEKLLTFWKSLLWDVHLRFNTVQNINLSFRVNSIIELEVSLVSEVRWFFF